jgi:hypothetical protein
MRESPEWMQASAGTMGEPAGASSARDAMAKIAPDSKIRVASIARSYRGNDDRAGFGRPLAENCSCVFGTSDVHGGHAGPCK